MTLYVLNKLPPDVGVVAPELALAFCVAPVLFDAAYDASLRDLRDDWAPVTSLVVFAVGFMTAAVALVAQTLIPTMPSARCDRLIAF